MKRFSVMIAVLLLAGVARGQSLEVNQAEILRLGEMVQHVDGQPYGQSAQDALVEALQPPADDADKWFISLIVTRGCAACQRLEADWAGDPSLLALADPNDPARSWAHYNVYYQEDQSQAWRWENITVEAYPTVLVQPPLNEKYGDPATVVYQGTYHGNPRHLALDITRAIRLYVGKLSDERASKVSPPGGSPPPWRPAPRDDSASDSGRRLIPPLVPEDISVQVDFPWKAIFTLLTAGFSVPAVLGLVIWLLAVVRAGRKRADQPLLLDDETFQKLLETLQRLADPPSPPRKTAARRKRSTPAAARR